MNKRAYLTIVAIILCALLALPLSGCGILGGGQAAPTDNSGQSSDASSTEYTDATPASDSSVTAEETTGEFKMTTTDGHMDLSGTTYTVTAAGTYSLTGALEGQIIVEAGDDDEVILELNGVTITCADDSPIKILSADKVEISAKGGTDNVINDNRGAKTADDEALGEGAIYAKADLKLKGTGTLVVNAGYNNGVHTTKDLTIQKLSLKVTACNNAIKGGDSITVKSGTVVAISTEGDGMKTTDTDADKHGNTRGDITLLSGSIAVYAAGDGIQAAHDFIMTADDEGNTANLTVFTGSYSSYTAESAETTSYKGVKAQNVIDVSAGTISISSYDDGLHADRGAAFEAGGTGAGDINISGGTVTLAVYSPENATGGGQFGPGGRRGGSWGGGAPGGWSGWSGQQTVSGADGIHADNKINISGGTISVDSAYEGLEANVINVSGGSTVVTAADDGMNACSGSSAPMVNITGGFLDVSVSPNGDVDGIDSNGSYSQTGGVVIVRGPNSQMAAALDSESGSSITGGTLIVLGYGRVSTGGSVKTYSLSLHSQGSHSVTVNGNTYSFTNSSAYGTTACYSDTAVSAS